MHRAHGRWSVLARWTLVWLPFPLLGLAVAGGCASRPLAPELTFERGPMPYEVGIFVDLETLGFEAGPATVEAAPDPVEETGGGVRNGGGQGKGGGNGNGSGDGNGRGVGNGGGDGTGGDGTGGGTGGAPAAGDPGLAPNVASPLSRRAPRVHYGLDAGALAASVARSISRDQRAVTAARVLAADNRLDALEAARKSNVDLLLAIGFETRPEYDEHAPTWGWGAVEIACWLFGGVPAWFVPSVEYLTESRLKVEVLDLHQGRVREWRPGSATAAKAAPQFDWKKTLESHGHNVSLWDRSHPFDRPLDYALTLVAPPMVLNPGDPARLGAKLTAEQMSDLGRKLASTLKARLLDAESKAPLSVAFVSPDPRQGVEGESVVLRLGIASRGEARVRAIDVHRFAVKVQKFRWVMPPAQVEHLAEKLGALPAGGGYVSFDVPEAVPIAPGENTIRVRVLCDDGETVTRTMVFTR